MGGHAPLLEALKDRHVVAAQAAHVGQRRGVEVQAAERGPGDQRLADEARVEEGDRHVDLARERVGLLLVDQLDAQAAGGLVDALRRVLVARGRLGEHAAHLAAARDERLERPHGGALVLCQEEDVHG